MPNDRYREYVGLDAVESLITNVAILALFLMMWIITVDAASRYLLNNPLRGVHPLIELYLMPAIVILVFSRLQRRGGNIRLDIFYRDFTPQRKRLLNASYLSFVLTIFLLIFYGSATVTYGYILNGGTTGGSVQLPLYISWGVTSVGLFAFCLRIAHQLYTTLTKGALSDDE